MNNSNVFKRENFKNQNLYIHLIADESDLFFDDPVFRQLISDYIVLDWNFDSILQQSMKDLQHFYPDQGCCNKDEISLRQHRLKIMFQIFDEFQIDSNVLPFYQEEFSSISSTYDQTEQKKQFYYNLMHVIALLQNDYVVEKLRILEDAATTGNNMHAQNSLGLIYYSNYCADIPSNLPLSYEWHLKSALQGHPNSLYNLGMFYNPNIAEDSHLSMDEPKAMYWLNLSAEQNYAPALKVLGEIYQSKNDCSRTLFYFLSLLEVYKTLPSDSEDYTDLYYEIGQVYYDKFSDEQDDKQVNFGRAIYYLELSKDCGLYDLAFCYYSTDKNTAKYYFKLSIERRCENWEHSHFILGLIYTEEENYQQAFHHFSTAIQLYRDMPEYIEENHRSIENIVNVLIRKTNDINLLEKMLHFYHALTDSSQSSFNMSQKIKNGLVEECVRLWINKSDAYDNDSYQEYRKYIPLYQMAHAGIDQADMLYHNSHDIESINAILTVYSELQELKWFLTFGWFYSRGVSSQISIPTPLLTMIGFYLPWFELLTLDPCRFPPNNQSKITLKRKID